MRELRFCFRGEWYRVDEQGRISANGIGYFSDTWRFLGGSRHHWRMGIDVDLSLAFANPTLLNGCLGWDVDHGTTRQWGGMYAGKLPRIAGAYVKA